MRWLNVLVSACPVLSSVTAPCVFTCPINGESFRRYVEQVLVLTLKSGDIVIMDNLGSTKVMLSEVPSNPLVRGCTSCGPTVRDLNPIEQVFSKLKHLLRKAKERTVEATWQRIGSLLDMFTTQECANNFANSGYGDV